MLVKIAQFISYLFHPLFTTFYLSVLGIFFHPTIRGRVVNGFVWQLILLLFASLVLIPMMSLFIVKKIRIHKFLENRKPKRAHYPLRYCRSHDVYQLDPIVG